jgi:hypothetical protein
MAIKRVTIAILDTSSDPVGNTTTPPSLITIKDGYPETGGTATPEQQSDYSKQDQFGKDQAASKTNEPIGRTPSDLIFKFFNQPQFMPTVLVFLSLIIFSNNINNLKDFCKPLVASVIMNCVWFGIKMLLCVLKKLKK